jgi:hypothetical protein
VILGIEYETTENKKIAHIGNLFRHRRDDVLLYCLVTNLEHDKMDNSMIPLQGIEIN